MGKFKIPMAYVIIIISRLNKVIIISIYFYAKYNYNYIFVKNMIIIHHKQITAGKRIKCTRTANKRNLLFELEIK